MLLLVIHVGLRIRGEHPMLMDIIKPLSFNTNFIWRDCRKYMGESHEHDIQVLKITVLVSVFSLNLEEKANKVHCDRNSIFLALIRAKKNTYLMQLKTTYYPNNSNNL